VILSAAAFTQHFTNLTLYDFPDVLERPARRLANQRVTLLTLQTKLPIIQRWGQLSAISAENHTSRNVSSSFYNFWAVSLFLNFFNLPSSVGRIIT
jgi:hypothetical protein